MSTPMDELPKIGAPATRALTAAGYQNLGDLIDVERSALARPPRGRTESLAHPRGGGR